MRLKHLSGYQLRPSEMKLANKLHPLKAGAAQNRSQEGAFSFREGLYIHFPIKNKRVLNKLGTEPSNYALQ